MMHTAWLAGRSFSMPDRKIEAPDPTHTYEPVRGTSAWLAVFADPDMATCLGWIDTRALGFESAKDWMQAQSAERREAWAREFAEWKRWHRR